MTEKDERQALFFKNRLKRNERVLKAWVRREGVEAYRLFDNDIPEIPLALDRYGLGSEAALHLALYERPYEKAPEAEAEWLRLMADSAAETLGVEPSGIHIKTRRRLRGLDQYEKVADRAAEREVKEGGLRFIVNLSDYLDTGLFLDHRTTRGLVRDAARGAAVLNLFAYTGSFSVYAASGAASSVTSVDLSRTYLAWAQRNLALNGFDGPRYPLVRADVLPFLKDAEEAGKTWDLIVADPPTFSNSKSAADDFDINRDWPGLLASCAAVLSSGGMIYFSTNSRKLTWESDRCPLPWEEVTDRTIPPDFRDRKIHRCWILKKL